MTDIARVAGVSQSTVSRVLNNVQTPVPITAETRQRVLAAAERLDYHPNPFARALRGAPTGLIGAIVREITDPFFMGAIEALTSQFMAHGLNIVLGHAHGRADEAIALKELLETQHCDAIVILGDVRDHTRLIADLQKAREPVVALWQGATSHDIPSVNVDNGAGIEHMLAHLVDLGHERLAFVGDLPQGDHRERHDAFVEVLDRLDRRPAAEYLLDVANGPEGGNAAVETLLALPDPPTAIVAANDQLAIGALYAAWAHGVRVPDDLSIAGFDDIPMAAFTTPPLTTVRMPISEIIAAAVEMVIEALGVESQAPDSTVLVRPTLAIRESTARPPEKPSGSGDVEGSSAEALAS